MHAEEVNIVRMGIGLSSSKMCMQQGVSCLPYDWVHDTSIFPYTLQRNSMLSVHGSAGQHYSLQQNSMDSVASTCCNLSVPDLHDLMIHV